MAKEDKQDKDPMFGFVDAANKWAKHQQDIAHQSQGIDPETGKPLQGDE